MKGREGGRVGEREEGWEGGWKGGRVAGREGGWEDKETGIIIIKYLIKNHTLLIKIYKFTTISYYMILKHS